jgi:hypothetical protein
MPMNDADRSQPDPELAPLLAALPGSISPPEALERRVLRATRLKRVVPRAVAAAAALVLFASGFAAGRVATEAPTPDAGTNQYALLLYEGADYQESQSGGMADRVAEYRAWARELSQRGMRVSGERLERGGIELQPPGAVARSAADGVQRISGFFIITAPSRAEAERVAKTCPHLRHGGRVVVKAMLPT